MLNHNFNDLLHIQWLVNNNPKKKKIWAFISQVWANNIFDTFIVRLKYYYHYFLLNINFSMPISFLIILINTNLVKFM
jgi:hypothetical protein